MGGSALFEKRSILALVLLAGALLLVWWSPGGLTRPVSGFLSTITRPFQGIFSWGAFELSEMSRFVGSLGSLKADQAKLVKENQTLLAEVARLRALESENEKLRELVGLKDEYGDKIVTGEVIGRDGSGRAITVMINRGTAEGVEVGDPVIGGGGVLVGQIAEVSLGTSLVRLLPNPDSLVSATLVVAENNGIVRGDHGLGIIFDLAQKTESFKSGEAVVTSGLGDGFPRGLLIGTIESVRPSADRLFQQAVLVSPISFETLRFIAVITE